MRKLTLVLVALAFVACHKNPQSAASARPAAAPAVAQATAIDNAPQI